jgi:hypothetical protein
MEDMQPGQVIMPNPPSSAPQPPVGAPEPERPEEGGATTPTALPQTDSVNPQAMAQAQPVAANPVQAEVPASYYAPVDNQSQSEWQYRQEAAPALVAEPQAVGQDLSWTAAEFVAHHKGAAWYLALAGVACLLSAIVFLLTHDLFSTGVILFVLLLFGIYASRQPRMQQYGLDGMGLHVGPKTYTFREFKTFSVTEEGSVVSIILMPLKRFMPPLTIYVGPESEDAVVTMLSQYLPFELHKADAIDTLLRRIHF